MDAVKTLVTEPLFNEHMGLLNYPGRYCINLIVGGFGGLAAGLNVASGTLKLCDTFNRISPSAQIDVKSAAVALSTLSFVYAAVAAYKGIDKLINMAERKLKSLPERKPAQG